jgi:putative transposase
VDRVRRRLPGVSERRACKVLGQPRGTQRHRPQIKDDEPALLARIEALVQRHPRYGYRRIWALLRGEGWRVNRKRVHRLWQAKGYKVRQLKRKKRRLGISDHGIVRRRATGINDVWCWDFVHDRDEKGRTLKWLMIEDEFTREGLALEAGRSIKAEDVLDVLSELMAIRGAPRHLRSDNGPEFIAQAIRRFCEQAGVETLYIEPGSPWQNGYAESFNSRLRDELLNQEMFTDLAEAQALADWWRNEYNHRRPHSSLGYVTPAAFAASLGGPPLRLGAAPLPCATAHQAIQSSTLTPITPGT